MPRHKFRVNVNSGILDGIRRNASSGSTVFFNQKCDINKILENIIAFCENKGYIIDLTAYSVSDGFEVSFSLYSEDEYETDIVYEFQNSSQSYAVNDIVEMEDGTIVRVTDVIKNYKGDEFIVYEAEIVDIDNMFCKAQIEKLELNCFKLSDIARYINTLRDEYECKNKKSDFITYTKQIINKLSTFVSLKK